MAHGVLRLTGESETGILNPDMFLPVLLYPAVLLLHQLSYTFTGKGVRQSAHKLVHKKSQPGSSQL